jgi:8-oxo-dGTP pyrophosphatase MutT (NUDIX family)
VWGLPKGGREPGESDEEAALREVREETGFNASVVGALSPITYWFAWPPERVRYRKTVHWYLMDALDGDPLLHDDEVEEVRFFAPKEAVRRAAYSSEKTVLREAAARLSDV